MTGPTHSINCELAHVTHIENLFVHHVRATSKPNVFQSEIIIDGTHPYLYENPKIANHVSGTTFIEAGRQLLKAITHLYYDIPIENRFVFHDINIKFLRWVKLNVPIAIMVNSMQITQKIRKHDAFLTLCWHTTRKANSLQN